MYDGGVSMRVLVLGVTTLALSASVASAQAPAQPVYPDYGFAPYGYGYGYAAPAPLYNFTAPAYGYTGPAYGPATSHHKRVQTGQQLPKQPQW
jgi:hypothetical protein